VLVAPTMNLMMWTHPATQANLAILEKRGVMRVGPGSGELACGEVGSGRMAEPLEIVAAIDRVLASDIRLAGKRALVTSGPTREPIDSRALYLQPLLGEAGARVAAALAALGADTVLVSGPTQEPAPAGVRLVPVETASENARACEAALPVDIAVMAAAVRRLAGRDRRRAQAEEGRWRPTVLRLAENPISRLHRAGAGNDRPALVMALAAETDNAVEKRSQKRLRKRCDWILANESHPDGTFGGTATRPFG